MADRLQSTEQQPGSSLQAGEKPVNLEVSPTAIKSAKERLQTLAKQEVAPNVLKEINQKLEDIETGKVSAVASAELVDAIKKLEQIERQSLAASANSGMSAETLVDYLNNNSQVDLVKKADELGAGYEATQSLMAQTAKRYAEDNKN
jgi:hypothetical protein